MPTSKEDVRRLNTPDPLTGWTALAVAVASGEPQRVNQLLKRGADATVPCNDDETPLLLATWRAPVERPLIVQMLLSRIPWASIDTTCGAAGNNTPLMCAIEKLDLECIRLLARAGARLHIKNDDGFNALEVAVNTGKRSVRSALDPDKEELDLSRLSFHVVTLGRHIVSWFDNTFDGLMRTKFGFSGQSHIGIEKKLEVMDTSSTESTPESAPEKFVKRIDAFIKDTPALSFFFKDNKQFMQDMARKLADLAKDPTDADLSSPEALAKLIPVTMHQQVIYLDDSGSMGNRRGKDEKRWENQMALANRITRITTRILPDGEGVALRFINHKTDSSFSLDIEAIGRVLCSIRPCGDTNIGTTLRDRILNPLVYIPLEMGTLKRPLLVSIITDGCPTDPEEGMLANMIIACGDELEKRGYPRDTVKFLIGQIGSSAQAVKFLDTLRGNQRLAGVTHVLAERLDEKFKQYRDKLGIDRWLIETLFKPLMAGLATTVVAGKATIPKAGEAGEATTPKASEAVEAAKVEVSGPTAVETRELTSPGAVETNAVELEAPPNVEEQHSGAAETDTDDVGAPELNSAELETNELQTDDAVANEPPKTDESDAVDAVKLEARKVEDDELETDEMEPNESRKDQMKADESETDDMEADEPETDEMDADDSETDSMEADEPEMDELEAAETDAVDLKANKIKTDKVGADKFKKVRFRPGEPKPDDVD